MRGASVAVGTNNPVAGERETRECGKRSKNSMDNDLFGKRSSTTTVETKEPGKNVRSTGC